jgi:hypothetical protein
MMVSSITGSHQPVVSAVHNPHTQGLYSD